jgi:hypothetical protein
MQATSQTAKKARSEKRRSARVPIENVTVEIYSADGQPESPEVCDIENLSEGGMLFKCSKSYRVGQTLRLTFLVPDSIVAIRSDAAVVHGRVDLSGRYVGVRFAKLGVPEHASLQQFVARFEQSN